MRPLSLKSVLRALSLLLAVMFFVKSSEATTAIMLTDEQLVISSRVIVLGEVKSVKAQWDISQQSINTYVKLQISHVLKGELQSQEIVFKQLGGIIGTNSTFIYGAPEYRVGHRVLLFLDTTRDGTLRIAHLFQGKYDVSENATREQSRIERKLDGEMVDILGAREGPEITNKSSLKFFTKKIKRLLRANATEVVAAEAKFENTPIVEVPPEYVDDSASDPQLDEVGPQYTFLGSYRWFEPDSGQPVTYRVNSSNAPIAGGGITEINQAMAAWTNVQTTALVLQNGGSTTVSGFRSDGVSAISFNDPLDQMSDPVGCSGTLAIGGVSSAGGSTRIIGGQSWRQIFEGDVVFNRNFSCFLGISANLAEVATHEIGHSIGFGHSLDVNAIMYASARGNGRGATLGSDDIAVVTFLYPGSKSAPPPTAPGPPSNLSAVPTSASAINISWADNSNNETGFRLERRTGLSGTYALIATLPAGQTSYPDSGLGASTSYYYRIKSYNTVGESTYSNEAAGTTQAAKSKVAKDFDSDARADIGVYRPSTGNWYIIRSSNGASMVQQWGSPGDLSVPADYDGDGKGDIAVYRPSTGTWYIINSFNGLLTIQQWGSLGDQPVSADYDGDGSADMAVYRPSTGNWYIIQSSSGVMATQWGSPGDVPMPSDYDGDGKADKAVYRPSTGYWYIINSSNGSYRIQQWGSPGDQCVPADYDRDGKADLAVYRPSTGNWYIINSSNGSFRIQQWGSPGDVPVPADYDGDGKADVAVYRPTTGNWYIINSSNGTFRIQQWGSPGDLPL